jgi:hypothetical protein
VYDPETKTTVWCHLKLHVPLDNTTQVDVFIRKPGAPPKTRPDHVVYQLLKGEDVEICKEEAGLRILVNSHKTGADPNPHPPGTRLTADETTVIPGVFK